MALRNDVIDRGKIGRTPALTRRADETYTDFISDARNQLLHAHWKNMSLRGNDLTDGEKFISQGGDKSPAPTPLQGEYILASRKDALEALAYE